MCDNEKESQRMVGRERGATEAKEKDGGGIGGVEWCERNRTGKKKKKTGKDKK